MRPNVVNLFIAVLLSGLLAFAFWNADGQQKHFVAVGAFVFCAGTLVPWLGFSYEYQRRATNLRVVCGLFFVIGLGINALFTVIDFSAVTYIVTTSIAFLGYIFLANTVYGTRQ